MEDGVKDVALVSMLVVPPPLVAFVFVLEAPEPEELEEDSEVVTAVTFAEYLMVTLVTLTRR